MAPRGKKAAGGAAGGLKLTDFRHDEAKRKNNPPAKLAGEGQVPIVPKIEYAYSPRRSPGLRFDPAGGPDKLPPLLEKATREKLTPEEAKQLAEALRTQEPWLEWAGKLEQQRKSRFYVDPVALHIHERVSAQAILKVAARKDVSRDLFADPQQEYHEAVQFYRHDVDWANRLILGDSLQVMASLARREDLAGKVQMIYMDPPYGIRFKSNFQPKVGSTQVKDAEADLTREPEMIRAYRDTWQLGVHSYLSYFRDRVAVARELLADSGHIFVQISDENVHVLRSVLDEVFGRENQVVTVIIKKKGNQKGGKLEPINDYLLWYARDKSKAKVRPLFLKKFDASTVPDDFDRVLLRSGEVATPEGIDDDMLQKILDEGGDLVYSDQLTSGGEFRTQLYPITYEGRTFRPAEGNSWKHNESDMFRVARSERFLVGTNQIRFKKLLRDFGCSALTNLWADVGGAKGKVYVVQTNAKVVERCLLMTTDPGDLVLDPTCGSGTTAFAAEKWARRWITIDTSRVSVAIARQRFMTAMFDHFRLRKVRADERDRNPQGTWLRDPSDPHRDSMTIDCNRMARKTLKIIAQNQALDPIFAKHEPILDKALAACNAALKKVPKELKAKLLAKLDKKLNDEGKRAISDSDERRWLLPPECRTGAKKAHAEAIKKGKPSPYTVDLNVPTWYHWEIPFDTDPDWPNDLQEAVTAYRKAWRAKMDEVDKCIADSATQEELVDDPVKVPGVTRVSGPFTVEAVQPPEISLTEGEDKELRFGGEIPELEGTFRVREVESLNDMEVRNVQAYLDQMTRLLKTDGVGFPNNKRMKFSRLERINDKDGLHAEGRWTPAGVEDDDANGEAKVGVLFGPQYGPVTLAMIERVIKPAGRRYDDLVIAAFNFAPEVYELMEDAKHPRLKIHCAHIRPDVNPGMEGLLKDKPGSQLFSVFGQPRTRVDKLKGEPVQYVVTMEGVDIYNPVENSIVATGADKVAAWFLDSDYDGRTFCITQAFFPDRDAWEKLAKALNGKNGVIDAEAFERFSGTESLPFPAGKYKCVAVKVIDPRGNEVMQVHKLG